MKKRPKSLMTVNGLMVLMSYGGVEEYNCGGVYYRPAFQGGTLVSVVQNP
jgi:hypothetical protein